MDRRNFINAVFSINCQASYQNVRKRYKNLIMCDKIISFDVFML